MSPPFISVIITAYGRREFLRAAVDSALRQSLDRSSYEVIVSKDFTDPEVDELIRQNNITGLILQGRSIGNRMVQALKHARGEVVAFLDDDDLWDEEKLDRAAHFFRSDPAVAFYHHGQAFIDEDGHELDALPGWDPNRNIQYAGDLSFFPSQLGQCDALKLMNLYLTFNASSIVVRRRVLEKYAGILETLESAPDDFMLFAALVAGGKILAESRKLTKYRVHALNISSWRSKGSGYAEMQGNYMVRQYASYRSMLGLVEGSESGAVRDAFAYSMNYVRLMGLLTAEGSSRREMLRVSLSQAYFSARYMVCHSSGSPLGKRKFGLWYSVRLSLFSILFLISPAAARRAYYSVYIEGSTVENSSSH